jgi:cellulose synthase/poly-beta-1,6-N-acetylglucosamine synthase-like glycosyltransferase
LERLVAPLEERRAAYVYGRQLGGEQTRFSEHRIFAKYFPAHSGAVVSPFFCNNANAALLADIWRQNPFDENLTGLEDMHLGKRLVDSGRSVAYVPGAAVHHYHHESWRKVRLRYEREAIALQKIMPEVHVHIGDSVRYFFAGVLGDAGQALSEGRLLRCLSEILAFRFCQYYGSWRGNHIHRQLSRQMKEKYFYPH